MLVGIKWVKIIIYWRNRHYDEYAREWEKKTKWNETAASCKQFKKYAHENASKRRRREGVATRDGSFHFIIQFFLCSRIRCAILYVGDARCKIVRCLRIDRAARIPYNMHRICNYVTKTQCNAKFVAFIFSLSLSLTLFSFESIWNHLVSWRWFYWCVRQIHDECLSTNPLYRLSINTYNKCIRFIELKWIELSQWVDNKIEIGFLEEPEPVDRNKCLVLIINIAPLQNVKQNRTDHGFMECILKYHNARCANRLLCVRNAVYLWTWPLTALYGLRKWWWNRTNLFQLFVRTKYKRSCYFISVWNAEPLSSGLLQPTHWKIILLNLDLKMHRFSTAIFFGLQWIEITMDGERDGDYWLVIEIIGV